MRGLVHLGPFLMSRKFEIYICLGRFHMKHIVGTGFSSDAMVAHGKCLSVINFRI
jgi:hypothetical protein